MVLCHRNFDHAKTQQPDLWHFDKPTSDGRCGIYVFKEKTESIQPTVRKSRTQKKKCQPTPIPSGAKLLRLPAPGKPPRAERPEYIPPGVPQNATQITYSYSSSQEVRRYELPDATNPKGPKKTYRQFHIDPNGEKIWNKGDAPWSAYRMDEVIELLKTVPDSEPIIIPMLEGEDNVEIARGISIAALSLQGSEWSDSETQKMLEALRVTGKNVSIGVLRDNDDMGIQKGKGVWLVVEFIEPLTEYPATENKRGEHQKSPIEFVLFCSNLFTITINAKNRCS
jgi:putative DNA primase/helicase